jgi:transposase
MDTTRRALFETIDSPALKPLPLDPHEYAEWKKARVNVDYHIEIEGHYYSVPYQLVKEQVDVRLTSTTIEILFKNRRGIHTTLEAHMPKAHQKYLAWTPSRIIRRAGQNGPHTQNPVTCIMERRTHPEQGFRSSLGIMRLAKRYSKERLEAACGRALALKAYSYKNVESILKQVLFPTSGEKMNSLGLAGPASARYSRVVHMVGSSDKCQPSIYLGLGTK